MRLLLDTCAVLWYFEGSERITAPLRDTLTDPANEVYVSDVSALEVVIKHKLGKLSLNSPPNTFWNVLVRKHALTPLPISLEDMFRWHELPLLHRDPFDRLLIAQALNGNLDLVTPDPLIKQYDIRVRWD